MRVFILEDDAERIAQFKLHLDGLDTVIAENIVDAAAVLNGPWDYVFLDHDLGGKVFVAPEDENTGSEFVRRYGDKLGEATVVIHSWNIYAAKGMYKTLKELELNAYIVPFGETVLQICKFACQQAAIKGAAVA